MIERRAAKRIPFKGKAMVRCGGLSVECGGVDLSENGVRLQLSAPASAPWQPIDVLLALSQRGGWVQLRARVRRVEAEGPTLRWGLSFEDPSAHALRAVRETLGQMLTMVAGAELPPPPPPPGNRRFERLAAVSRPARELPPLVPQPKPRVASRAHVASTAAALPPTLPRRPSLPPPTPRRASLPPPTPRRASLPPPTPHRASLPPPTPRRASLAPRRHVAPPPLPVMRNTPTEVTALLEDDEPTRQIEVSTEENAVFAQAGIFRIDALRRRGRGQRN